MNTTDSREPAPRRPTGEARLPRAVLWDMDGTLVDTEPYWIECEFELIEEHGGTWSHEHAMNLVGNDLLRLRPLHPRARRHRPGAGRDRRGAARPGHRPGRGRGAVAAGRARAARRDLRERGVRCALVTMSYRRFVDAVLRRPAAGTFEVDRHRRRASARASRTPSRTSRRRRCSASTRRGRVAIEDSNTGARSAEAAGCTVLVVENHVPVLPGRAARLRRHPGGHGRRRPARARRRGPRADGGDAGGPGHRAAPLPGQGVRRRGR